MKNLIDEFRFEGDSYSKYKDLLEKVEGNQKRRIELLSTSLKITKDITPSLYNLTISIQSNLQLTNINIEYYVYNDFEINAACFSLNNDSNLILMISSGLINLLKEEELPFVIGHEIGHYLLGHLNYVPKVNDLRLNKYYQSNEISADRFGLVSCGSIEHSLKAIVKTISGLSDKFISDNLYSFINQHNEIDGNDILSTTHPTLPTRAKALVLFSMSEQYYKWINSDKEAPIKKKNLDSLISRYLKRTSLKEIYDYDDEILDKFKMWYFSKVFLENNEEFSEDKFISLSKEINIQKIDKLIKFIRVNGIEGVEKKLTETQDLMENVDKEYQEKSLSKINLMLKKYNYTKE